MATTERTRTSQRRTADDKGTAATGSDADAAGTAQKGTGHPRTATVNLPFVTAQFRAPDLHLPKPRQQEVGAALQRARNFLPSPQQALYYGGLGLMAALELVEWPVAAAIGVGTALARRGTGGDRGGTGGSKPPDARSSEQEGSADTTE